MAVNVLDRAVKFITASNEGQGNVAPLDARLLLKRVISIYGLSGLLFLFKFKRILSSDRNFVVIRKLLRNSSALAVVSSLYPVLQTFINKDCAKERNVLWGTTVITSLIISTNIPAWLSSYITIESVSGYLLSLRSIRKLNNEMDDSTSAMSRQAILCLIVPLLYNRTNTKNQLSRAGKVLFGKRSLMRDFVLFYSIWNFLSLYNFLKNSLLKRRKNTNAPAVSDKRRLVDEWPMLSTNLKPLMDKLGEIHELTLRSSYSVFEKLMNSPIVGNVIPSLKWALWRQLCYKSLLHVPRNHHRYFVNTSLMKSITLMLGFFVLDGSKCSMNVRPGVLRYLIRCILTTHLEQFDENARKALIFAGSHLAFYNHNHI